MSSAMWVLMKSDGFIFMRCLLQMVYPQKIKVHGNFFPLAEEQQSSLSLFLFLSLLHYSAWTPLHLRTGLCCYSVVMVVIRLPVSLTNLCVCSATLLFYLFFNCLLLVIGITQMFRVPVALIALRSLINTPSYTSLGHSASRCPCQGKYIPVTHLPTLYWSSLCLQRGIEHLICLPAACPDHLLKIQTSKVSESNHEYCWILSNSPSHSPPVLWF